MPLAGGIALKSHLSGTEDRTTCKCLIKNFQVETHLETGKGTTPEEVSVTHCRPGGEKGVVLERRKRERATLQPFISGWSTSGGGGEGGDFLELFSHPYISCPVTLSLSLSLSCVCVCVLHTLLSQE